MASPGDDRFVISNHSRSALELHNLSSTSPDVPQVFGLKGGYSGDALRMLLAFDERTMLSCTAPGEVQIWDLEYPSFRGAFRSGGSTFMAMISVLQD